jgi:hypothetical protein
LDQTVESYEKDLRTIPSITSNIIAGFLIRNFELNDYKFDIIPSSSSRTFDELLDFFQKDTIEVSSFLSLHGPSGDLEEVKLNAEAFIVRADQTIADNFNRHYSASKDSYIDMFEGDYALKVNFKIQKEEFGNLGRDEKLAFDKWFTVPLLAGVGNIEKGKIFRETIAWPVILIVAPHSTYSNINRYDSYRQSGYFFTKTEYRC